ncbi:phosphatase PAP2 family protein [Mycoplasmatota bacterium]|nr:phosphatase PAP2 family protein [Mycoplasmatota bacterium]
MDTTKLKKTIIPMAIVMLFLLITYFGNQWYADTFGNPGVDYSYIFKGFNDSVPFISWHIYPYIIAYPFWFFTFLYVGYRSQRNMFIISAIAIIAFTICGIWYFFWQSDVEAWRVTSGLFIDGNYSMPRTDLNFTEKIVMWIYQSAGPRNALPSMHTISSWIAIIGARLDKNMPKVNKIIIYILALMIIIATQTLKQHYIIDLIVGVILTEGLYWIVLKFKIHKFFGHIFTKLNFKFNLQKKED